MDAVAEGGWTTEDEESTFGAALQQQSSRDWIGTWVWLVIHDKLDGSHCSVGVLVPALRGVVGSTLTPTLQLQYCGGTVASSAQGCFINLQEATPMPPSHMHAASSARDSWATWRCCVRPSN
jgi:hypothetical protein